MQAGAAPPEAGPGARHPGESKQPREDPPSFPRRQRGASDRTLQSWTAPTPGPGGGLGASRHQEENLRSTAVFPRQRPPGRAGHANSARIRAFPHIRASALRPPLQLDAPKDPKLTEIQPMLPSASAPTPDFPGSPSTTAAPAHLLLKSEAWEPCGHARPCTWPHQSSPGLGNAASQTTLRPTALPPAGLRCPNLLGHTTAPPAPCGLSLCMHTPTLSSAAFRTSCTLQGPPSSRLNPPHPRGLLPPPPCPSDASHL